MSADFPLTRTTDPVTDERRAEIMADPGFGRYFTDHMATAEWTRDEGWHDRKVTPLVPFSMHPSAAVLHYGQEIFEGMKAYRHADDSIWLFRPTANAARFARSARRLALPELDEESFLNSIEALVRADQVWVPEGGGEQSLYLRPYMFASEAFLGVRPSARATYAVIACPAGPYFTAGVTGVTLWITSTYSRSAPGGTGDAKCGGNYAGSLAAQIEAQENGCDQVMYLDSTDHSKLEESGTMNLCLVTADGELITPSLGRILEGVTRDTVLALATDHGLRPVERDIDVAELRSGCENGSITEVFASGTAAVITPILGFKADGYAFDVADGKSGKHTLAIRDHVLDIQYGRAEDKHGWMHRVV